MRASFAALAVLATTLAGLAGCALIPTPAAPAAPQAPTETDTSFEAISKRYLNEMMALTPVNATALGDHRFDDRLDDVSAAGYQKRTVLAHELLAEIQALDARQLSRANQVDARWRGSAEA